MIVLFFYILGEEERLGICRDNYLEFVFMGVIWGFNWKYISLFEIG